MEKPKKLSLKPEIPAPVTVEDDDEELKQLEEQLRVNLDADYFKWKDEQEEQEAAEEKRKIRRLSEQDQEPDREDIRMTILVCDDDKEIVDAIEIYLIQEGYQVVKAYDGEQALEMLRTKKIDLMVIDVMMPKLDGIRATFQARKTSSIPIIILSAKTEDADKILGLNVGADDYVTKPFNPLELVARVKSQLRRYTTLSSTPSGDAVYEAGGLVINDELKKLR